jgi:hypothetical protein
MKPIESGSYDPETIELLRTTLEDAWASLSPARQAAMSKIDLAERILRLAGRGERDPDRLRAGAVTAVVFPTPAA